MVLVLGIVKASLEILGIGIGVKKSGIAHVWCIGLKTQIDENLDWIKTLLVFIDPKTGRRGRGVPPLAPPTD